MKKEKVFLIAFTLLTVLFLSGCNRIKTMEEVGICPLGEITIPADLYIFVDGEYYDWNPFYEETINIEKNCGDCGEKVTLCDARGGYSGNYSCSNIVYEGYFPCIEENSYTITEDMLKTEERTGAKITYECADGSGGGFDGYNYPKRWGTLQKHNCTITITPIIFT